MTSATLAGKTALITGAARGIGASLALSLVARGVNVALVGLEPAVLAETAKACAERATAGAQTQAWEADVTDRARMSEVVEQVVERFGAVDIAVANAGIAIGGPFTQSDPDTF